MPRLVTAGLLLAASLAAVPDAGAQILRELDPIRLRYAIRVNEAEDVAGTFEIAFEKVDTDRGRRLKVTSLLQYSLGVDSPVEVRREATLFCDPEGIEKFQTLTRVGEEFETISAFRRGEDYHLTITKDGKNKQRTETAGVQRSVLGLFAAAFQAAPITEAVLIEDYPMLYPTYGRHFAHQRFSDGVAPSMTLGGDSISVAASHLNRLDKTKDLMWHRVDHPHGVLLRKVENVFHGTLTYELTEVDGEPVDWVTATIRH